MSLEGVIIGAYIGPYAQLVQLTFRAKKPRKTILSITKGTALAHDGKGTEVLTTSHSAHLIIHDQTAKDTKNKVYLKEKISHSIGLSISGEDTYIHNKKTRVNTKNKK